MFKCYVCYMKNLTTLFLMASLLLMMQSCTSMPPASLESQEVVKSMTDSIHKDLLKL